MYAPMHLMSATTEVMSLENRPHHIGELAEKFGITLRSIRFYEQKGLIRPRRIGANMRIFEAADVARLGLIVTCRRYRFTVDEIADLLRRRDALDPNVFLAHFREALAARHDALGDEIRELEALRSDLSGHLADVARGA